MGAEDLQSKAAELMKKVLTVGVGAIFLTEESLRALVTEFKLPKELLNGILDSGAKTKKEFLRTLSKDVLSRVVDKVDPAAVLQEFVARNEFEFTIKVSVKPKTSAAEAPKGAAEAGASSPKAESAKPEEGGSGV